MLFVYSITDHTGRKTVINAKSRTVAIESYLKEVNMPEDFFKKHCKIENLGVITGRKL